MSDEELDGALSFVLGSRSPDVLDARLRALVDSLTPEGRERLKILVNARTSKMPPPPTDGPETYRGVPVPGSLRPNWDQHEASWWRLGVNAALDHAADEIVRETRNATGAPGVSEVWDLLQRHAAKLAGILRSTDRTDAEDDPLRGPVCTDPGCPAGYPHHGPCPGESDR